jgi:putative Holliday junction resolvase
MRYDLRILAIDHGERKVGLALSDPSGTIASGIGTIDFVTGLVDVIRQYVDQYDVRLVLVGMPLTLKGDVGERARVVQGFIEKLSAVIDVPVEAWDERFTSTIAENARIDAGVKKKDRRDKRKVDEVAAIILLQSFLDSRRFREWKESTVPDRLD